MGWWNEEGNLIDPGVKFKHPGSTQLNSTQLNSTLLNSSQLMLESWAKHNKTIARWRQQVFVRECRTSVEFNFGGVWVLMEKKMIRFFLPTLLPSCVGYIKAQHKSFQLFFLLYEFGNHNPVFWKDKKTSCRIERTHPCLMQTLHISSLVCRFWPWTQSIELVCSCFFFFVVDQTQIWYLVGRAIQVYLPQRQVLSENGVECGALMAKMDNPTHEVFSFSFGPLWTTNSFFLSGFSNNEQSWSHTTAWYILC